MPCLFSCPGVASLLSPNRRTVVLVEVASSACRSRGVMEKQTNQLYGRLLGCVLSGNSKFA